MGIGRTVAESVTPAGSGTAGLLLMKSALVAPAGAPALRWSPDEGAPELRRSDGSLGVPSSSPPSEPGIGAGAGAGVGAAEGEGPNGAGRGE